MAHICQLICYSLEQLAEVTALNNHQRHLAKHREGSAFAIPLKNQQVKIKIQEAAIRGSSSNNALSINTTRSSFHLVLKSRSCYIICILVLPSKSEPVYFYTRWQQCCPSLSPRYPDSGEGEFLVLLGSTQRWLNLVILLVTLLTTCFRNFWTHWSGSGFCTGPDDYHLIVINILVGCDIIKAGQQKRWSVKRFIASISLPALNTSSL
jgi:hypothetical protein